MQKNSYPGFLQHDLDGTHAFWTGQLPEELVLDQIEFEELWGLHPEDYHVINMPCGPVKTPRWQQAYDRDYHYTGRTNRALPLPAVLKPLLAWVQKAVHPGLNGVLVNYYDGQLGHHIGAHRDSIVKMLKDAPIVTVSFGEDRVFRLRPWKGKGFVDFPATHGAVFLEPYDTNRSWTHEVFHAARYGGRRISVTFRAFED